MGRTLTKGKSLMPAWERDGHRMYLGDAREILPRLADESVDFVFMDPPYGHNNNNGDLIHRREAALGAKQGKCRAIMDRARPIANDGPEANDLFRDVLPHVSRLLRCCCCCCCCCGGGGPDPQFARWSLWLDEVMAFKQMVVWDKGPIGMGWHYRRSYETVLVAQKGKGKCRWYDTSKTVENIIRPGNGIKKIVPRAADHPTPKPPELAEHFIRLHSQRGHTVLDPFVGGGSTGIACVRTGRKFIGIELDRKFLRMAIRRIESALDEKRAAA